MNTVWDVWASIGHVAIKVVRVVTETISPWILSAETQRSPGRSWGQTIGIRLYRRPVSREVLPITDTNACGSGVELRRVESNIVREGISSRDTMHFKRTHVVSVKVKESHEK